MLSETKYKVLIAFIIFIVACFIAFNDTIREEVKSMIVHTPQSALCVLGGNNAVGTAKFTEDVINGHTVIDIHIEGLSVGWHATHIHQNGHVETPGPHYNPHGSQHGDLGQGHIGDLGNLTADENGVVDQKITSKDIKLRGPYSVCGRLLVIRTEADDFETGKNGKIAAYGIIGHSSTEV